MVLADLRRGDQGRTRLVLRRGHDGRGRGGKVGQQSLDFVRRLGGVGHRDPAFELVHVQHVVGEMLGELSDYPIARFAFTDQRQAPVVSHGDGMYTANG
jgi:hypothetical protein